MIMMQIPRSYTALERREWFVKGWVSSMTYYCNMITVTIIWMVDNDKEGTNL